MYRAGIRVEVFDEARGRVGIEVIDHCLVTDIDLAAFDERRHRDDDGKILDVTLEIIGHRDDCAVLVANENNL